MTQEEGDLPEQVDVEQARMAVAKREVRVIDVRSADEYAEERIYGSIHSEPDSVRETIDDLDEDGPQAVLLVCADGESSSGLADDLRSDGRTISSLEGGFDAWTSEHLPTAPGRDEEYEGPDVKIPGAVASKEEPDDEDESEGEDVEDADDEDAARDSG